MIEDIQRSVFQEALGRYAGEFGSAYADLQEQAGDAVVSENKARRWHKEMGELALKETHTVHLEAMLGGEELTSQLMAREILQKPVRQMYREVATDDFLRHAVLLMGDHEHARFEEKYRLSAIPKVAEILGIPEMLRTSQGNTPQQAHRSVPHVASTFGSLTDRQVLTFYVREGENMVYLTNTLKAFDPTLSYLTPETVTEKLRLWQKDGVVMDAEGTVMDWDAAILELQMQLRTLTSKPSN